MGTLVVDRRGSRLAYKNAALIIAEPEGRPRSVPLALLERIVIAGGIQIDSSLFTHLAEQGISVLVLPARGYRRTAHLHGSGHGNTLRRLGQYALATDSLQALHWAKRFVALKVMGQMRLLRRAGHRRAEVRHPLEMGCQALAGSLRRVRAADSLDSLRGYEGAASAQFFQAYRVLFADALGFTRRTRRPPTDPANALLSLGYTLLHGDAVRAAALEGLDPMLGFLHAPSYNRESLACDVVEIARSRIESLVWRLFAEQSLRAEDFTRDGDAVRLGKAGRGIFFAAYEQQAFVHRAWFRRSALALARACAQAGNARWEFEDEGEF